MANFMLAPLGDKILIELIEDTDEFFGGSSIKKPDISREMPKEGRVLALGPGGKDRDGKRVPFEVEVGDVVVFAKYCGNKYEHDGKTWLLAREEDLLARKHAKD